MTKDQQTVAKTDNQQRPMSPHDAATANPSNQIIEQANELGAGVEEGATMGEPREREPAPQPPPVSPPQAAGAELPSPEELTQVLEETKRKAEEHWNALLRSQAELENLRKRSAREVENAHKYGLERFLSELLPVKDSLELGVAAAQDDAVSVATVREGMELTLKMFKGAMDKFGVEEVDPQNEAFNPEFHQAMSIQETDKVASGTVLTVVQKGCLLNGRLVRPAMVIVAK